MNYQCSRCGISWEGPIQECPKCEQTDKVSVQTEEKVKDACKSGTWEHDEGFKAEEKAATVPLAVAEGLDLSKCPVCGATSGIEKWNSEIVWCRSCHSRITNEWWMKLKSSNCRPDAQ